MPDITQAPLRAIAAIGSFRDRDRVLAVLQAELGTEIPTTPRLVQAGALAIACLAPRRFLAFGAPDANLVARLARSLDGLAAVTDQSDMWATWHLSGGGVRECLARVVPIDLSPVVFRIGDLALTRAGHLDVRLSRTDAEAYEIAVNRSLGADLLHACEDALRPTSQ